MSFLRRVNPRASVSHSLQKPLQFRQKKTSTSSQQPVRKRKSRLSFPLVSPFAHFQRGICQPAGKSSRRIWFTFQEDNACFETTAFYSMAITISVICCYAKELMVVTYWECREAMTSRNSLWQECLGSPVLKKVL